MATIDEVKVAITADTKGLEKGVNDSKKALGDLGTGTKGLNGAFATMRDVMQGPIAALKDVGRLAMEAVRQFADAELATVRLGKAVENNPSMSGGAADRLSSFADELQKVTMFEGDATKAIIANLAAMGMSEDSTKRLIKVAMDYASATGDSLESAVTKLNATLQGSAGALGRQNKAIKDLTEEELKNGKAIDILEKQYSGFAETVGDTTAGKLEILKNKLGDFVESIGERIATALLDIELAFSGDKAAQAFRSIELLASGSMDTMSQNLRKIFVTGSPFAEGVKKLQDFFKLQEMSLADYFKMYTIHAGKTDELSKRITAATKAKADEYKAEKAALDSAAKAISDAGKASESAAAPVKKLSDAVVELSNFGKGIETALQPMKLSEDDIKKLQDAQKAVADLAGSYVNLADAEIAESNAARTAQGLESMVDGINKVSDAVKEEADNVDYLGKAFEDMGRQAGNALLSGVNDLFHAMDVAGSNMGDIWGAAAESFDMFMVKFIDQLPMLLLQAGLQLIGFGQWIPGLAMIAAAGGIALVDALTTSDAEQKAYGTGAYTAGLEKYATPESAPTTGSGTTSAPAEDLASRSGSAGTTVNIYGVRDTSPAALRREMEGAGRQLAFMAS